MTHTLEMIETMPGTRAVDQDLLVRCIEACFDCAQTCTSCADACLQEETVASLRRCIRLDLTCADICDATGKSLSRHATAPEALLRQLVEICAAACRACGEECESHGDEHDHCAVCAEACSMCEEACTALLASL